MTQAESVGGYIVRIGDRVIAGPVARREAADALAVDLARKWASPTTGDSIEVARTADQAIRLDQDTAGHLAGVLGLANEAMSFLATVGLPAARDLHTRLAAALATLPDLEVEG